MAKTKKEKLDIEIEDKNFLLQVCGVGDYNLKFLEERLSIQIIPKGNKISILGDSKDSLIAYNVLYSLYELAFTGMDISPSHITMALKIEKNKQAESVKDKSSYKIKAGKGKINGEDIIVAAKQKIIAKTSNQKNYIKHLKNSVLCFAIGPAGTGKTHIATAMAVQKLMNKEVERIVITRPVLEAGENLGYLPGTLEEKIDPYLRPFFDSINQMIGADKTQQLIDDAVIEIAPLAYMRGRTIKNSFMLLDEAQNTTKMQMKMFLTRLGENSQIVVTGDPTQIDLPKREQSGLLDAVNRLKSVEEAKIVKFDDGDVVRHEVVSKIIKAYEK